MKATVFFSRLKFPLLLGLLLTAAALPGAALPTKDSFEMVLKEQYRSGRSTELLISSWVYVWEHGESPLQQFMKRENWSESAVWQISFFQKALLSRRSQLSYLLRHRPAEISWLDSALVEGVQRWSENRENDMRWLASLRGNGLLYAFIRFWEEKKYLQYWQSGVQFVSEFPLIEKLPEDERKILGFALVHLATTANLSRFFQNRNTLLSLKRENLTLLRRFDSQRNLLVTIQDEYFHRVGIPEEIGRSDALAKKYLDLWAQEITEGKMGFQRARVSLRGRVDLDFHFNSSPSRHEVRILSQGKLILANSDGKVYWPVDGKMFLVESGMDSYFQKQPMFMNLSMGFKRAGSENSLDLSFRIAPRRETAIQWSSFWKLLRRQQMILTVQGENLHIFSMLQNNPFQSKRNSISFRNNKIEKITFVSKHDESTLAIDMLVAGNSQGTIFPLQGIQVNEIEKLRFPVSFTTLNQMLMNRMFSQFGERRTSGSDLRTHQDAYSLYQEISREEQKIGNKSSAALQKLAKSYHQHLVQHKRQEAWLWLFIANLYYRSYDFVNAKSAYERYFYILEDQSSQQSKLHINLPQAKSANQEFFQLLLHLGEYPQAMVHLNRTLPRFSWQPEKLAIQYNLNQQKTLENMGKFLQTKRNMADLYFRTGKLLDSAKTLENLLQQYMEVKEYWVQDPKIVRPFLETLQNFFYLIALANDYAISQKSIRDFKGLLDTLRNNKQYRDLKAIDDAGDTLLRFKESRGMVRLKLTQTLPGQGKNYCVPVTAQFILKFFGNHKFTQFDLAKAMETGESGTTLSGMASFMKEQGFRMMVVPNDPDQIVQFISMGIPLVTMASQPNSDTGHMIAMIAFDRTSHDSYMYEPGNSFAVSRYSRKELARALISIGNIFIAFIPENMPVKNTTGFPDDFLGDMVDYLFHSMAGGSDVDRQEARLEKMFNGRVELAPQFYFLQKIRLIVSRWQRQDIRKKDVLFINDITAKNAENKFDTYYQLQRLLGIVSFGRQNLVAAKTAFLKSISDNAYDMYSYLYLARIMGMQKSFAAARAYLMKAYRIQDYYYTSKGEIRFQTIYLLAQAAIAERRVDEFTGYILHLTELQPGNHSLLKSVLADLEKLGAKADVQFYQFLWPGLRQQ